MIMVSVSATYKRINHEPCYASGMVNPKTTALFFDKIWIPDELAQYYHVPISVRMIIDRKDRYLANVYSDASHHNLIPRIPEEVLLRIRNEIDPYFSEREWYARQSYSEQIERMRDKEGFLTSFNRNEAIRIITNTYHLSGIEIIPIFVEQTDFERSLLMNGPIDYSRKEHAVMRESYETAIPKREVNAIAATLKSVSMIVEDSLSWDQVIDIRRDGECVNALHRFRTWASQELDGRSQNEVVEIIGKELDDYSYALKKHGVLTSVGGFTTMLSMASTIVGAIEKSQAELIAAGLMVSAGVITFSAQQLYEYFDTKRHPIAYIYDVIDKT